jgi:hypothetical protein
MALRKADDDYFRVTRIERGIRTRIPLVRQCPERQGVRPRHQ